MISPRTCRSGSGGFCVIAPRQIDLLDHVDRAVQDRNCGADGAYRIDGGGGTRSMQGWRNCVDGAQPLGGDDVCADSAR